MGIKGYREGIRYAQGRLPDTTKSGNEFPAHADWPSSLYRTAMADIRRSTHPGFRAHRCGDLLESKIKRCAIIGAYVAVGLAVCLLYDINFVYIFLATSNVILFGTRLVRAKWLDKSGWVVWFSIVNLAKSAAFFLAGALILNPSLAQTMRPYLRYTWLLVFVLISIVAGDKAFGTAADVRKQRELFEYKAARKEEL